VSRIDRLTEKGYRLSTLDGAFGFLLQAAWRDAQKTFNDFFAGLDITPSAYAVLLLIEGNPGCTPGDLSEIMAITPNNMSRLLDDLVRRDLIARGVAQADRRVRCLQITHSGERLLRDLVDRHEAFEAHFSERIGVEQIDALRQILRRFD
jgi:DNA-binding MarR family transcriptional regulator